jgi:hypothetical protein
LQALFPGKSLCAILSTAKRYRIRKAKQRFRFTPEQIAYIQAHYSNTENTVLTERLGCSLCTLYGAVHGLGLKKSNSLIREQLRRISLTNHAFLKNSFRKGNIPLNTGKKIEEYMSPEGLMKFQSSQFKPGNKSWKTKYDGAITVRRDTSGREYKRRTVSDRLSIDAQSTADRLRELENRQRTDVERRELETEIARCRRRIRQSRSDEMRRIHEQGLEEMEEKLKQLTV